MATLGKARKAIYCGRESRPLNGLSPELRECNAAVQYDIKESVYDKFTLQSLLYHCAIERMTIL